MSKSPDKLPFLQLYGADLMRDCDHLSLAAFGGWIKILLRMHSASTRGLMRTNKNQLARCLNTSVDQADAVLHELLDPNNPSGAPVADHSDLGDGVIELRSRRMLRDEAARVTNRENGMRGGNPKLVNRNQNLGHGVPDNQSVNPVVKPGVGESDKAIFHTSEIIDKEFAAQTDAASAAAPVPNPSTQTKPRNRQRPPAVPLPEIPDGLNTPAFADMWTKWLTHRRERRDPVTSTAATLALTRLLKLGPERAIEAIQFSISNNWRGIFEEKEKGVIHGKQNNVRDAAGVRPGEFRQAPGLLKQLEERTRAQIPVRPAGASCRAAEDPAAHRSGVGADPARVG